MDNTNQEKSATDWHAIEVAYRMGVESLRSIAASHNCTEGAIRKRAKRDDWLRDLNPKVRAKADELVRKAEVRNAVRTDSPTERETVDANATLIARIRLSHRKDIATSRTLAMNLLSELQAITCNRELFERLGQMMEAPDDRGVDKLNELYQKVISLSGRTKTMKELAETLRTLISLEREAFGMTNTGDTPNTYEQNLIALAG